MFQDFLTQMSGVDMGVDLGGGNGFVTKHRLDGTQIGTSFKQRGGKRMAKGVRGNGLLNPCFLHEVFNHQENHHPCKGFLATMTDKDKVLILERNGQKVTIQEVKLQLMDGFL